MVVSDFGVVGNQARRADVFGGNGGAIDAIAVAHTMSGLLTLMKSPCGAAKLPGSFIAKETSRPPSRFTILAEASTSAVDRLIPTWIVATFVDWPNSVTGKQEILFVGHLPR